MRLKSDRQGSEHPPGDLTLDGVAPRRNSGARARRDGHVQVYAFETFRRQYKLWDELRLRGDINSHHDR